MPKIIVTKVKANLIKHMSHQMGHGVKKLPAGVANNRSADKTALIGKYYVKACYERQGLNENLV